MKTTSIQARKEYLASNSDKKDYQRILNVLSKSEKPMTFKEIAMQVFLNENSTKIFFTPLEVTALLFIKNYASNVSRRLNEMVKKRMICEDEKRYCSITGKNCYTYLIKESKI